MYGTLISTQTLASTAASVTFSSIPQTYTDLVLVASSRTSNAQIYDAFDFSFNSINAGYSTRILYGNGSTAASSTGGNTSFFDNTYSTTGNTATASTFGSTIVTIPNYAGSTNKVISVDSVSENNAVGAYQNLTAGLVTNTAAITSIIIFPGSGGTFAAGSMFSLYGLTHF